jgi:UDP-N-acetylglucosamine diphosphorylase/glucosamine-1-phosphate N-acetyltransferase
MNKSIVAIIMAGGLGKRMESNTPKVLHKVAGIPMINHILLNLKEISTFVNLEKVIIVVGKYKDQIKDTIEELIDLPKIVYVTQEVPQGTGHAIMCCKNELVEHPHSDVLILSGDVPLLSTYTMQNLLNMKSDVKLIITKMDDPTGYGRILINDGIFEKIVEQKDCSKQELEIVEINGGIYCIKSNLLCKYLSYLRNDNNQSEYYLTDIIEIIKIHEKIDVDMLEIENEKKYEIIGVNTAQQLLELEELIKKIEKISF